MQPTFHGLLSGTYSELTVPLPLVMDLQDSPVGIGVYSLIARQFVISKTLVALSAADILHYDPALRRGAVLRALRRLISSGWLVEQTTPGHKARYAPTWGLLHGHARPWSVGLPLLGRPRRMIVVRVGQLLLDICLGKITPHATRTALVERYLTRPLLSLADVGAYVLTRAGYPTVTAALLRCELVHHNQAQPVPSEQQLLALASQQILHTAEAPIVTERGLRRVGYHPESAGAPDATPSQTLFFVPKHLIGTVIGVQTGNLIGQKVQTHEPISASGRPAAPVHPRTERSHGLQEKNERNEYPPLPPRRKRGGSAEQAHEVFLPTDQRTNYDDPAHDHLFAAHLAPQHPARSLPSTPAAQALHAINVLPAQIVEFAMLPIATVQAAIRDGQTRDGVRDLAGWVVHLLRNVRDHHWTIRAPQRADAPEALRVAFAAYAAEQRDEGAHREMDAAPALIGGDALPPAPDAPEPAPSVPPVLQASELWAEIQATLRAHLPRAAYTRWVHHAQVQSMTHEVISIAVQDVASKTYFEDHGIHVVRDVLCAHGGRSMQVRVGIHGAPRAPAARQERVHEPAPAAARPGAPTPVSDCPTWIAPQRWMTLPRMLRAALAQSTLAHGCVQARTAFLTRLLETRYTAEVQTLLAALEHAPGAAPVDGTRSDLPARTAAPDGRSYEALW